MAPTIFLAPQRVNEFPIAATIEDYITTAPSSEALIAAPPVTAIVLVKNSPQAMLDEILGTVQPSFDYSQPTTDIPQRKEDYLSGLPIQSLYKQMTRSRTVAEASGLYQRIKAHVQKGLKADIKKSGPTSVPTAAYAALADVAESYVTRLGQLYEHSKASTKTNGLLSFFQPKLKAKNKEIAQVSKDIQRELSSLVAEDEHVREATQHNQELRTMAYTTVAVMGSPSMLSRIAEYFRIKNPFSGFKTNVSTKVSKQYTATAAQQDKGGPVVTGNRIIDNVPYTVR